MVSPHSSAPERCRGPKASFTGILSRRFSRAAKRYEVGARAQELVAEETGELVASKGGRPKHILEVGCGTGFLTRRLLTAFPESEIVACDLAHPMLECAQRATCNLGKVEFVQGDVLEMNFSAKFQLIVSSSSFHWIRPLPRLARRLMELLESGGRCVFSAFVEGTLGELREVRGKVAPGKELALPLPTPEEFRKALETAGFIIESIAERDFFLSAPDAKNFVEVISALGFSAASHRNRSSALTRRELSELYRIYDERFRNASGGVSGTFRACFVVAHPPALFP